MDLEERVELTCGDERYPASVRELDGAPETLYVRGSVGALSGPCLAVVGSRRATPYGLAVAETVGTVAAECGVAVVSGGAIGCDQAAGRACLKAGGVHIAVLGCGADVVYPRSSGRLLQDAIDSGGSIVSLDSWGTPPRRYAFPRRNRVIAALSKAVCVTEARMPSGTFSTAEAAVELGRELLAVPGSILSPESRGTNALISDGATIVVDEESLEVAISRIFGTLRYGRLQSVNAGLPEKDSKVIDALVANPMRPEELASLIGGSPLDALSALSGLAAAGLVERLADGRFSASKVALHARSAIMHNREPSEK